MIDSSKTQSAPASAPEAHGQCLIRLEEQNAELLLALQSLRAVACRYLPNYDEHPEIQTADEAISAAEKRPTAAHADGLTAEQVARHIESIGTEFFHGSREYAKACREAVANAVRSKFGTDRPIAADAVHLPIELQGVAEEIAEGSGFWHSCSGCHESNEGHPTGPHSAVFGCALGNGCSECGGIGAVWDDTDYEDMARFMMEQDAATTQLTDAARPTAVGAAGQDVLAERCRQVDQEGYDTEHDDEHASGEIAAYAAFYAMPPAAREWPAAETGYGATLAQAIVPHGWPIPPNGERRRELVKAGALILAEIERIDRATAKVAGDLLP